MPWRPSSLWVRRTWARRWLGLLGLGLLIAVVGGITLAVTAGARRTASAFDRLQARQQRADDSSRARTAGPGHPRRVRRLAHPGHVGRADRSSTRGQRRRCRHLHRSSPRAERHVLRRRGGRVRAARRLMTASSPDASQAGTSRTRSSSTSRRWPRGTPGWARRFASTRWLTTRWRRSSVSELEDPSGPVIDAKVVGISRGAEDISDLPEPIFFAGPGVPRPVGPADRRGDRPSPWSTPIGTASTRSIHEAQRAARSPLGRESCGRPRRLRARASETPSTSRSPSSRSSRWPRHSPA